MICPRALTGKELPRSGVLPEPESGIVPLVSRGFTLIEVIVGLAILAILATIAVPAYQSLIATQRVSAVTNDLHSALVLARSESLKRNKSVSLGATGAGWQQGWSIASPDAGAPAILSHSVASGIGIASSANVVTFSPSGRTSAVNFEITSDINSDAVRCLKLTSDGRAKSAKGGC